MDGYDIVITKSRRGWSYFYPITYYRVYQWNKGVKHYRNGYHSYKEMVKKHPELSR